MFDSITGMTVIQDPALDNVPCLTVSSRFAELMPEDFVSDLNAWMLARFGTHSVAYRLGDHTLIVGPKIFAQIKERNRA